jgi:hypothetical protein
MLSRVSIRKPPRRSIMRAITRWRGPAKVPYEERECMEARHGRSDAASGKVPSCLGTHVLRYIGMRFNLRPGLCVFISHPIFPLGCKYFVGLSGRSALSNGGRNPFPLTPGRAFDKLPWGLPIHGYVSWKCRSAGSPTDQNRPSGL